VSDWYSINNLDTLDTPALAVYPERVAENIRILKSFVPDVERLCPHVKTHKSPEITKLMMEAGFNNFKCATIAEAEMLAMTGVKKILLAYPPIGPKVHRLINLTKKYLTADFSCLIDNLSSATALSHEFEKNNLTINVFIDVNVGMNRTGISPEEALTLYHQCRALKGIAIIGLHAYDGHIRDSDLNARTQRCDEAFEAVETLRSDIEKQSNKNLQVIAGGTPTFPIHARRINVLCSPGTFVYWDKGYQSILHEQPFLFAALVITRVISKPTPDTICIDLGHKSIASENTLDKRVFFLNADGLTPVGHSEEHMVLKIDNNRSYTIGDVLYGVPYHICPTVALHDRVAVIKGHRIADHWTTLARNRAISV